MKQLHLLIAFLLYLLPSCSPETELVPAASRRTVLVYMAGNNNLNDEVYIKIDSITRGWHNQRDNLLIYQDASGEKGTPSLLKVVGDDNQPYTIVAKEYPETNSADPAVFSEVVRDVLTMYPSPSYGLLVFSHGTGWLPEGMFTRPRSCSVRSIMNDNGHEMEIADFAAAIPDHTFDFIVMEACLMSGVEAAYELRNKANYLIASSAEILSPGFTPIYPELMNYLFEPEANLTAFAEQYYNHCNNRSGVYRSGTVSLLCLKEMDGLADATRLALSEPHLQPPALSAVQCYDRGSNPLFFDLGDYMQQLNPAAYPAVEAALNKVVLYTAATPSFVNLPIRRHSGLTTYIEQSAYPELNKAYRETAWGKITHSP